jgi:hypothetical protein
MATFDCRLKAAYKLPRSILRSPETIIMPEPLKAALTRKAGIESKVKRVEKSNELA